MSILNVTAEHLAARSASAEPSRTSARNTAMVAVKLVHTAIFAVVSTSVMYVFACGVRGRPTRWTGTAIAIVLAEAAVFGGNHWQCPLTGLGRFCSWTTPPWYAMRW